MNEWMVDRRRRAFEVVDEFERTVSEYTGAPHVVAVDSCTNALFLSLLYEHRSWRDWILNQDLDAPKPILMLPKRTYVGVAQAAWNAGWAIRWREDGQWRGRYRLEPTKVVDAAKRFTSGMYESGTLMCVSFQAGKLLPIGRGGAILTDDAEAATWLRRARFDGRTEGARCDQPDRITTPGYHCYLDPPSAARGLWLMTYLPKYQEDQVDEYEDLSTLECFR